MSKKMARQQEPPLERSPDSSKFIAAFLITLLVFVVGILLGNNFAEVKLTQLQQFEQDLQIDTLGLELQFEILSENPCITDTTDNLLSEELYELGSKIEYMENSLNSDDPSIIKLKTYYSILQLRHWLLVQKTKEKCGIDVDTIIYFYSNKKDLCSQCDEQGVVLTYIRKKYPTVRTYAFDRDIMSPAVDAIKAIYLNGSAVPALIINTQTVYGFHDAQAITELIEATED